MTKNADFLVVGAGVVGVTIAREIKKQYPEQSVVIIEKEPCPGLHSSGRNSGVLHSGIYYPPDSIKAKICAQGRQEMADYCESNNLPLKRLGKVLLPTREEDGGQLDVLVERGEVNGVEVERINEQQLKDLEPEAHSAIGDALYVPSTSVGSPKEVIKLLVKEVEALGCEIRYNCSLKSVDVNAKCVTCSTGDQISYGHVVNTAGLHADTVAHKFDVGKQYTLLPFKGIYWKLDPDANFDIRHLIYPVPDLRVPFLGVHTTTSVDDTTYIGPTAVPAFGRENYYGCKGVSSSEFIRISSHLMRQFIAGRNGFRQLAWQEGRRYFKTWFAEAGRALLPRLEAKHLLKSDKVGIRAQMLDTKTGLLVMDFLIENGPDSTHVLNAISPAWTSAFPFARFVLDQYINKR